MSTNNMAILEKIRLEVIARKFLQEGASMDEVVEKLMQDTYSQGKQQKLGKEKLKEIVFNLREKTQASATEEERE